MKTCRIIQQIYVLGTMLILFPGTIVATPTAPSDSILYKDYPYVRFVSSTDSIRMSDDEFYAIAARIGFAVNEYVPAPGGQFLTELSQTVLPRINKDSLKLAYMMIRGTASPEGPYENNKRLGEKRAQWLIDFIRQRLHFPVKEEDLRLDIEAEDYGFLCHLMRQAGDKDYSYVKRQCDSYLPDGNVAQLKSTLQSAQDGRLWQRLKKTYFYQLRTARVVLFFKKYEGEDVTVEELPAPVSVVEEATEPSSTVTELLAGYGDAPMLTTVRMPRRELLAVKTNLLFYGVYMPGYNRWCPIPNIALEYYPKRGHFTYGASFDMPWWQDYDAHKYFQLRNYQVESRYYFKTQKSQEPQKSQESYEPAYRGFYLQGYVHGGVFGICFDADRGWVGEGIGGGIGGGYVMPLSRNGHWRLELGLQAGFFRCKYDPYQYENPIDPGYHDNLYYYKWTLESDLFKKRQYRWNWIGPTRVGVTLSYDLLYRRQQKCGVSFRDYEIYETHEPHTPDNPYQNPIAQ